MRKTKILALSAACLFSACTLAACGGNDNTNLITIQFVPSRDAQALATSAKALVPILKKYEPNYDYEITTGTDYAAVTQALYSDQIDIGFLTASGYAQSEVEKPGKVDLLLTSTRDGYQVQNDTGNGAQTEENRKAMVDNMNSADYKCSTDKKAYLGQQTSGDENKVTFYNSVLFSLSDSERAAKKLAPLDANNDGEITVDELAGKTVAIQGQTSGAGYLYPSFFLFNLSKEENRKVWMGKDYASTITDSETLNKDGMTIVDGEPDAKKGQIKGLQTKGYDAALAAVMNGQVDAAFGFMDIRYANGYNKEGTPWYKDDKLFSEKTRTIAMTPGIYNDTISCRANLDQAKKDAVVNAFKKASKDGDKNTKGTGAQILYEIYSHTGYKDGDPEAYKSEVEMYKWKVAHGK